MKLTYTILRGRNKGLTLTPHRYADGFFLAHKTNSRNDPQGRRVRREAELVELVRAGYHVRMSNPDASHAPSTANTIRSARSAPAARRTSTRRPSP